MKPLFSLLFLLAILIAKAQVDPIQIKLEFSGSTDKYELIAHPEDSDLPDTLVVKGKIIQNYKGICGDLCAGGTIKIELSEKIEGYPYWYVYAISTCYEGNTSTEEITLKLSKYSGKETECYYTNVIDIINSENVPYYKLSEEESGKLAH